MLPAPFLGTPSAMAKSADDIARSLNVSDLDPLRTPSVITSRTAACANAEAVGSISEGFLETGT